MVIKRILNCRLKEICDLEMASERKNRTRQTDEIEPIRLAENIRDIHKGIADAWYFQI